MPYILWGLVVLIVAVPLVPLLLFIFLGRRMRSYEIIGAFSPRAITLYLLRFWTGDPRLQALAQSAEQALPEGDEAVDPAIREQLRKAFKSLYDRQFGGWTYFWPTLLLVVIVLVEAAIVLQSAIPESAEYVSVTPYYPFPGIVITLTATASLAGAYMWVVGDIIRRVRQRDCLPSDIYWHCSRLAIAVPLGYAISKSGEGIGSFVAFGLGAFPMEAITRILRRLVGKALNSPDEAEQVSELIKLASVDPDIAARLQSEAITNIQKLASSDPVLLSVRASLPFDLVMECINEAVAWRYFRDDLAKLKLSGLRGAYEIKDFVDALNYRPAPGEAPHAEPDPGHPDAPPQPHAADARPHADVQHDALQWAPRPEWQEDMPEIHRKAVTLLPILAHKLGCEPEELQSGLEHIAGETYTRFIYRIWV